MSAANVIAVIPAAGSGLRMGGGQSKLLLQVAGQSILRRTVNVLKATSEFARIVIPVNPAQFQKFADLNLGGADTSPIVDLIPGGETRQESVLLALRRIVSTASARNDTLILIHDGARCLVSPDLVRSCIRKAAETGAAVVGTPVNDSLKQEVAGTIKSSISRDGLWSVQTPQVFRFELLLEAHEAAARSGVFGFTDDAALIENRHPVSLVLGERNNIKITQPEDIVLAEAIIAARRLQAC